MNIENSNAGQPERDVTDDPNNKDNTARPPGDWQEVDPDTGAPVPPPDQNEQPEVPREDPEPDEDPLEAPTDTETEQIGEIQA